jgi:hypothetical protein
MEKVSIKKIKELHKGHFFDKATMTFFDSRLPQFGFMDSTGDILFITSEHLLSSRKYTVRRLLKDNGSIDTEGTFQEFQSLNDAKKRLKMLARY